MYLQNGPSISSQCVCEKLDGLGCGVVSNFLLVSLELHSSRFDVVGYFSWLLIFVVMAFDFDCSVISSFLLFL